MACTMESRLSLRPNRQCRGQDRHRLGHDLGIAVQRGRADAESASECMAGLKAVCTDKLGILEESIGCAMQAVTAVQAAERKHHWASGVVHTLTPSFLVPRK